MTNTELETCIREYGTDLYSFCRYLTPNKQEADDLYQDTFLKAMEPGKQIDRNKNPKGYLLAIALGIWKNRKRKYAWRNRIAGMQPWTDETEQRLQAPDNSAPEAQILEQEEQFLIRQAVEHLPERFKIVVLLFYMEDFSIAQIASILKIPAGTVKSRLYQSRKRLEKELEVVLDDKIR